jgi:hypothetical protein
VRQLGAAAELAALHLRWLDAERHAVAAAAWDRINQNAETFILKTARAVDRRRAFDAAPFFDECAEAWQQASDALQAS